jgi:type VI secretion system protein ImpH
MIDSAGSEEHPEARSRLFREFYCYSFFQAVGYLERSRPEAGEFGKALSPKEEGVRFRAGTGFSFPASDIANLEEGRDGVPPQMEVAFLGVVGPSGALPDWYHELALERNRAKDPAMAAFYDLFHHRLLSLFYLAWKRRRVIAGKKRDHTDRFSNYLLSLIGLGTPGSAGALSPERAPLFFSGQLARKTPTAGMVAAVVQYQLGMEAEVEQFVPRLVTLEPEDRAIIGEGNCELGKNASCGGEAWESQTTCRLRLGPMSFREFNELLPGSARLASLVALVRYLVGAEYEFEVRLVLKKEELPPLALGATGQEAPRLGWSTWMKTPGTTLPVDPQVTLRVLD